MSAKTIQLRTCTPIPYIAKCPRLGCGSQVTKLCDLASNANAGSVCSVAWSQRGTYLSVGTNSGKTQVWDVSKIKMYVSVLSIAVSAPETYTCDLQHMFCNVHLVSNVVMGHQSRLSLIKARAVQTNRTPIVILLGAKWGLCDPHLAQRGMYDAHSAAL